MKKMLIAGCIGTLMVGLSSCNSIQQYIARHHNASSDQEEATDTATSNILASRVFYGTDKMHQIAGGQLLFDYLLDQEIGQYMDWQDIVRMQNAVLQTPVHVNYNWTNSRRHVSYTVRPTAITYNSATHRYCRSYQMLVKVKDRIEHAAGRVCHDSDGRWHVG
jgi:surface antigen